jgi:hypothetical protein
MTKPYKELLTEIEKREFWIRPAYRPEDEDRISFCKVPKNDFEHVISADYHEWKTKRLMDALSSLINQIEKVQCTGPNQKYVLKELYNIAEAARLSEWFKR